MHPSPTHFSTAAGRQGETSRRTSDVCARVQRSPTQASGTTRDLPTPVRCAALSGVATARPQPTRRGAPPLGTLGRALLGARTREWPCHSPFCCGARRRAPFGQAPSLQAHPPELLAPERGHAPPAAQRGGVGARRLERIRLATGTRSWRRANSLDGLDQADTRTSINLGDVPRWLPAVAPPVTRASMAISRFSPPSGRGVGRHRNGRFVAIKVRVVPL